MRLRYCPFDDLTVRSIDGLGARLGRWAVVDFDQVIGMSADGAPLTMEAALGEYAAAFTHHAGVEAAARPSPEPNPTSDRIAHEDD